MMSPARSGRCTAFPKLDLGKVCSWWCDAAREWCRARGQSSDIKPSHFVLAVLTHGDIDDTYSPARWLHDLAFALSIGTSRLPRGGGWLQVLEREAFRVASAYPVAPDAGQPRQLAVRSVAADYVGPVW